MRPMSRLVEVLATFDRDHLGWLRRKAPASIRVGGEFELWEPERFEGRRNYQKFRNTRTIVGANSVLDTAFRAQAQITTWYAGLVNNSGFSAFSVNDTMSSHAGWTEFINYSGGNRATWTPAAASGGIIANTTVFTYSISLDGTLAGMFITSSQAQSATTGILWATAAVSRSVTNGSTLQGTYTYTLTPGS